MHFFMEMKPPTATAQEHSVKAIKGRPVFFDPPNVKDAKNLLMGHLAKNKPKVPFTGAVELTVLWLFPRGKSHKHGDIHEYQILLEQRYLCFKSWEQISVDLGYSIQHTFRLHDEALKELSRFHKDES